MSQKNTLFFVNFYLFIGLSDNTNNPFPISRPFVCVVQRRRQRAATFSMNFTHARADVRRRTSKALRRRGRQAGFKSLGVYFRGIDPFSRTNDAFKVAKTLYGVETTP